MNKSNAKIKKEPSFDQKNEIRLNKVSVDLLNTSHKLKLQDEIVEKMRIENTRKMDQLQSCCGSVISRDLINFSSKFCVIFAILIFSFFMVVNTKDNSEKNIFIIIINTILSIFLPSPSYKSKKQKSKD